MFLDNKSSGSLAFQSKYRILKGIIHDILNDHPLIERPVRFTTVFWLPLSDHQWYFVHPCLIINGILYFLA